jgi:tetratricopeptide (TPR) repeat protein
MYGRMERNFIDLLSHPEVRRMNDSLDWVERFIEERRYADADDALKELYYRVPRENFKNSASAALSVLGTLKDYPEAEYWIGEVYLTEGELSVALRQFQKALDMRNVLENPGFATELVYKIADIRRIRQEHNEMERTLLSILSADTLWSGRNPQPESDGTQNDSFERQAMTRTLEINGINRFLTLYRYKNTETEQAHRLLGFYYAPTRHSRAQEHLMFSFLIQNTVIIDEVIRSSYDFTFTNLETLAAEFSRNRLVLDYIERCEYYKTAYYLALSLYGNGKTSSARGIWNFLAAQNRAGEWQNRAAAQLRSPQLERPAEMP